MSYSTDSSSNIFDESISISDAYLKMLALLNHALKGCDLESLKIALTNQVSTPRGIKLKEHLKEQLNDKITAATSCFHLISILGYFPFCNWLDTRLVEALRSVSDSKYAFDLIEAYKKFLHQKKFCDALSEFTTVQEHEIEAFVIAVSEKIGVDPNKITIGDFMKKKKAMEQVILDLLNETLCIKHVKEGCLEFSYFIPVHSGFNAYKMALHNRCKFYAFDLIQIEIGVHPMIYDPWFSDLQKQFVKQAFLTQHEGKLCYCIINMFLIRLSSFSRIVSHADA